MQKLLEHLRSKRQIVDNARWSGSIDRERFNELESELADIDKDIAAICRVLAVANNLQITLCTSQRPTRR